MKTMEPSQQTTTISSYCTTASAIELLVHYFVVCYERFRQPGPFGKVMDTLVETFRKFPLTGDEWITKGFVLILLIFPILFFGRQTDRPVRYKWPLIGLSAGL
ncbi:MAG TPA: YWFCY domain-containing protein, partial [Puia sp.]|nr:YWFCY domain-containing protein [Puia sp.]